MWKISWRDLEYRSRRFLIAVLVTALVFGIAVAIDGIKRTLQNEPRELVESFDADGWVVSSGSSSPFTTTAVFPASALDEVKAASGVRRLTPIVVGRATVTSGTRTNANVIGYSPQAGMGPEIVEGRAPKNAKEVMVTDGLDVGVGDTMHTTAGTYRVVGRVDKERYNGGAPTILMTLPAAQRAVFGGQPLVMGIAVQGRPETLPKGTQFVSNDSASGDLVLTIKSATSTIDFVALLTWVIAAGVIGAIIYLTAIERTRDFAVMRATGVAGSTIVGGLMLQSLLLALTAALLSVPLAFLLRLGMPLPVTLSAGSLVKIVIVGILVGVLASLAAVRRALTTDPALAFGGV
jgi:putative ABC transport system permease protein